jgi:hypothetical protein
MFNPRTDFTLFWSMPPDERDWSNLRASTVKQVMLVWKQATPQLVSALRASDCSVVLRMENDDLTQQPGALQGHLRDLKAAGHISGVILGVEPDGRYDLTWASKDWGLDEAWQHTNRVSSAYNALRNLSVPIISPGHAQRGISEADPPSPGQISWREICTPVYNECDGNGVHIYGYGWVSRVDETRFKYAVQYWATLRHKLLWIDEASIGSGSPTARMKACIEMARILKDAKWGSRVAMFCPFVSNGTGVGYQPQYVMREPEAYTAIRDFLAS